MTGSPSLHLYICHHIWWNQVLHTDVFASVKHYEALILSVCKPYLSQFISNNFSATDSTCSYLAWHWSRAVGVSRRVIRRISGRYFQCHCIAACNIMPLECEEMLVTKCHLEGYPERSFQNLSVSLFFIWKLNCIKNILHSPKHQLVHTYCTNICVHDFLSALTSTVYG